MSPSRSVDMAYFTTTDQSFCFASLVSPFTQLITMRRTTTVALAALSIGIAVGVAGTRAVSAQDAKAPTRTMLLTVDLPEMPGKEMRLFITDLPPGSSTTKHQHPGHMVAY